DDAAVELYRDAARVPFAAHSQLEHVRWLVRSTPRFDGRRYLAALRDAAPVPSLQLHGELDPALRVRHARSDARYVGAGARYEVVAGAGHFVPEEAPEEVSQLLREWLAVASPAERAWAARRHGRGPSRRSRRTGTAARRGTHRTRGAARSTCACRGSRAGARASSTHAARRARRSRARP